ncbi:MAG: PTS IIA-like nitrogen regulatory protein PtsN [Pseudomonadota bacterium]|nr:PTS IIA-like nitrogen regulatory protein PtsN [Pseudomonadota bacterium]
MFPPQFIVARRIGHNLEIGSKKRLLEALGELLASDEPALNPETVFERLLERERLGSTGLGHGIALPHARIKEVRETVGAFVQLASGVDFDAIDDGPVDLAFALLVPESANEGHLQLLSQLAAMFSDPGLREHLRNAESEVEILRLLEEWEERLQNA